MVDKTGLQIIGWIFGSTTALVMLVAAVLVGQAIASVAPELEAERPDALVVVAANIR